MNAISVHNLGKKFKLFRSQGGRFLEYISAGAIIRHTDFWALQDVSFDIPAGTTLGILGQNGSGKSTLLSILAGVLEQSTGSFEIHGKVSAILELGSGFHPEFSGRDNVHMYGSIMGLSKTEINDRFDEIVRFSELGDFIDQPLRTYSSGMIVRLAFSVAVNVDADILIVDEALAVGDAIFQHRCFRKIREMQEAGKTILYVGHDADAVRNLCTQALLLDGGQIIERGDPNVVVNKYFALITDREETYNEGNLVEHGNIPSEGYETLFDFIQHLPEAKKKFSNGVPVTVQTREIKSVPRQIIIAHPPSQIEYIIHIDHGCSLAFAIGILPEAWEKIPQGVKFDIDASFDSVTVSLFSRILIPKRNIGDRGWHNFIIPLDMCAGRIVSLVFRTSGSGDDLSYCWSAWGWGKVVRWQSGGIDNHSENVSSRIFSSKEERFGNKRGEITLVELLDIDNNAAVSLNSGDIARVRIHILLHEDIPENLTVGCTLKNKYCEIYGTNTKWQRLELRNKKRGDSFTIEFSQQMKINAGTYSINAGLVIARSDTDIEVLDRRYDCLVFRVEKKEMMVGIIDLEASIKLLQS